MGEAMFYAHALSQLRAARGSGLQEAKFLLQPFIGRDANGAAFAIRGMRAPASQLAWSSANDLSSCVTEEVDRILDSARTIKRAGINSYTQLLGQLFPVELFGLFRQLECALQQPAIESSADQSAPKLDQRALREK